MEDKKVLLEEIASLIESDKKSKPIKLEVMDFMSIEELQSIKNSLIKKKVFTDREKWYDELVNKCGK